MKEAVKMVFNQKVYADKDELKLAVEALFIIYYLLTLS